MTARAEFAVGARVRLVGSPWPEREGCHGTIVDPPRPKGQYPQPARSEVLVLLDRDPLVPDAALRGWSCCVGRKSVEILGA